MSFTRATIITEGLSQAGRSDLVANGRLWLNLFLDEVYRNQDLGWLIKKTSLSGVNGTNLPSDYRAAVATFIGASKAPIKVIEVDQYEARDVSTAIGSPDTVYIDRLNKKLYCAPQTTETIYLDYYHIPTLPDHTDSGTDSLVPVWDMPAKILIQAVYVAALEYNDDLRFEKEENRLAEMFGKAKLNNQDKRAGSMQMRMGKSFKGRHV